MNEQPLRQSEGQEPILRTVDLRKGYTRGRGWRGKRQHVQSLQGIDLQVRAGQSLALIGASGSGKSTLARCLAGLERPDSGELWIAGRNCGYSSHSREFTQVHLIFQDCGLSTNPRFTASEIVSEPLLISHWGTRAERTDRAINLMKTVGLPADAAGRRAGEFSGGQRRRLAVARALALEPRVLILDEALAGLDLSTQGQMANLLLEIQQARALTYLWISHDLSLVLRLASEIAVMDEGRIVESASVREWFAGPRSPQGQALLQASRAWRSGAER